MYSLILFFFFIKTLYFLVFYFLSLLLFLASVSTVVSSEVPFCLLSLSFACTRLSCFLFSFIAMRAVVASCSSSSKSVELIGDDDGVESLSLKKGASSRYHLRRSFPVKIEPFSPCSASKTVLVSGSASQTPSVGDVVRPRSGAKFESNQSFNKPSYYSSHPLDLDGLTKYVSFSDGYNAFAPDASDRMWKPPHPGCQAIPDVYFEHGLRLPLHPFFRFVLHALNCSLSQLVPNMVLQINGVIARCHELGQFPTLDLFFSIFRVKSTGVQFYVDKEGCRRLVEAPVSNSGWHVMWAWYEGPGLGALGSWQAHSTGRVKLVNHLGSVTSANLQGFLGSTVRYHPEEFIDDKFLTNHCCKP